MFRRNLFCQHARFIFGSLAMEIIQPLLLSAVEDKLGQKPRDVLEYLLKGSTHQTLFKGESEISQLSFESFFQLLSQAQEELGGQSWFEMFVTKPNEEEKKNCTRALSTKTKEEAWNWFDFCCTQAAEATNPTTNRAMIDVSAEAKAAGEGGAYDRRLYFLMDLFSGLSP